MAPEPKPDAGLRAESGGEAYQRSAGFFAGLDRRFITAFRRASHRDWFSAPPAFRAAAIAASYCFELIFGLAIAHRVINYVCRCRGGCRHQNANATEWTARGELQARVCKQAVVGGEQWARLGRQGPDTAPLRSQFPIHRS